MPERLRLSEVLGVLALGTDLAFGRDDEHALRATRSAVRLAARLGLSDEQQREVFQVALLRLVGCTAHAHEVAAVYGDEIVARNRVAALDLADPRAALVEVLRHVGTGHPLPERVRLAVGMLVAPRRFGEVNFGSACEVAQQFAVRLGVPDAVRAALGAAFERWDGKGFPAGIGGEEVPLPVRVAQVAADADLLGPAGRDAVRRRSGGMYDPAVATAWLGDTVPDQAGDSAWEAMLAAEPGPHVLVAPAQVDETLGVLADFADLKSPWLAGHSRRVAALAESAAERTGCDGDERALVRRAALVHDLGRVGVPNSVWDAPRRLSAPERERVRLHAYTTERLLAKVPSLHRLSAAAGLHHERLDGSGYHRGATSAALPPAARLLAAADVYEALTADRPHRPALDPNAAARVLRSEPLDTEAVEAVLAADGVRVRQRRKPRAAGLTDRELDVLRLLVRGLRNRQIADELVLSERTVAHHVAAVLAKTGSATRAGAALWAVAKGLLPAP